MAWHLINQLIMNNKNYSSINYMPEEPFSAVGTYGLGSLKYWDRGVRIQLETQTFLSAFSVAVITLCK
jgi:hypothetical protein